MKKTSSKKSRDTVPLRSQKSICRTDPPASSPRNRFLGSINDYKYGLRRDDLPFPELNIKGSCSRPHSRNLCNEYLVDNFKRELSFLFVLLSELYIFIPRGFQQLHIISCLIYEYPELGNVGVIRY